MASHVAGRWRIVDMDMWDRDAIGLVGPAFIEFNRDGTGQFAFIAVEGYLDCRAAERDNCPAVEFSWTAMMKVIRPRVGDGPGWKATGPCTATSSSTVATIRASRQSCSAPRTLRDTGRN